MLTIADVFIRLYSPTYGYLKASGETWRQHIPVVGLSQSAGNTLNHSEGEGETENQPPKYILALGLSKRPDLHEVWPHTQWCKCVYMCARRIAHMHTQIYLV